MKRNIIYFLFIILLLSCSKKETANYKYYDTGEVERKISYANRDDSTSFKAQYFYKSGKLKIETVFKNGKREGRYVKYYETGRIEEDSYYLHGLKHGIFKQFNHEGDPMNERCYYDNRLILNMVAQVNPENNMIRHVFYKPLNDSTLSEIGVLMYTKEKNVFEDGSFFYDVIEVDTNLSQMKIRFYNKKDDYLFAFEGIGSSATGLINQSVIKAETFNNQLTINYPKKTFILNGTIYLKKDSVVLDFPFFKQF
jgi:hypothetical protein